MLFQQYVWLIGGILFLGAGIAVLIRPKLLTWIIGIGFIALGIFFVLLSLFFEVS